MFGEPMGVASRALPDGTMDSSMGQLAGVGMGAASAVLFAFLLKGAAKCAALFQPPRVASSAESTPA